MSAEAAHQASSGSSDRRWRPSLSTRVLLLVGVINVLSFGVAGLLLFPALAREAQERFEQASDELAGTLREAVRPGAEANVASILDWPRWNQFADAIVVDSNLEKRGDRWLPRGVALNPRGQARRGPEFSRDAVFAALESSISGAREDSRPLAAALEDPVEVLGGRVQVIWVESEPWGGLWYRAADPDLVIQTARRLAPAFALSTLLLTLSTFILLRRAVLEPVRNLARAAGGLERGEMHRRAPDPGRASGELADLTRRFNAMADEVQTFQGKLSERVDEATRQAREAEHNAMLQRRLAAMGELAAGIAHEINNPLGGLLNAVDALRKPSIPTDRRERYLALLADGLERIRGTVGQTLRMAPREHSASEFDLLDVVRDACALVRHRADQLGVALSATFDGRDVLVHGTRAELASVGTARVFAARNELGGALLNLLQNALDALEPQADEGREARLTLSLEPATWEGVRAGWRLLVSDNGPGLEPDLLERARDLFFTTKDPGRGTGLGLSIVHNVMDSHGGRLELVSRPGAGFQATLWLPVGQP